ncbi:uncharacterized protein LOC122005892 [Zingiber officinale]|uniref:uncharacterized protein LOC122005892 n=1 Tax=Zingiber officinale TaxID=94328 RepID=UPI001C4B3583|nr:uncharacterized protein LOC122005892 [Zingiber officinale]
MIARRICEIVHGQQAGLLSILLMGRSAIGPMWYLGGSGRRSNRRGSVRAEDDAEGKSVQGLAEEESHPSQSPWEDFSNPEREEVLEAVQDIQGDGSGPKLSKFINHCNKN